MINQMIEIKPLSVNEAWQGQRFKTQKYKDYEQDCFVLLTNGVVPKGVPLSVTLVFGFSNKAADIDNPTKPILDILQKKYGFNDKDIYELIERKKVVKKGCEFVNITIAEI